MGFAAAAFRVCVIANGVARFDAFDQRAKCGIERRDVLHVENFSAGFLGDFPNIYEAGNLRRVEARAWRVVTGNFQIVEAGIRRDSFGDDIFRALAAGAGANVVADQDDYAAAFGSFRQEILRGDEDTVIDVGGAARFEGADFFCDGGFVFGKRHFNLSFGAEGEERDFVVGLQHGESCVGGVAQRAEKRADGIAEVENERDIERQFVAAENRNFLQGAIFADFEIFLS